MIDRPCGDAAPEQRFAVAHGFLRRVVAAGLRPGLAGRPGPLVRRGALKDVDACFVGEQQNPVELVAKLDMAVFSTTDRNRGPALRG